MHMQTSYRGDLSTEFDQTVTLESGYENVFQSWTDKSEEGRNFLYWDLVLARRGGFLPVSV